LWYPENRGFAPRSGRHGSGRHGLEEAISTIETSDTTDELRLSLPPDQSQDYGFSGFGFSTPAGPNSTALLQTGTYPPAWERSLLRTISSLRPGSGRRAQPPSLEQPELPERNGRSGLPELPRRRVGAGVIGQVEFGPAGVDESEAEKP